MRIIEQGRKVSPTPWTGRYRCAYCKSVIEVDENDEKDIEHWGEDQREGYWVTIKCPVCQEVRSLMDCDDVIGRCGGLGRRDK